MSEKFGTDLLAAIEKKMPENIVLMKELRNVVRCALGLPDQVEPGPPVFVQQPPKAEFPQWRVRSEGGKEISRRAVYSRDELALLFREDAGFSSVDWYTPVPPREG